MTDYESALENPAAAYVRPADICDDPGLSQAQKVELLDRWRNDVNLRLIATEENMPGSGDAAEELRSVNEALERLGVDRSESNPSPAKN